LYGIIFLKEISTYIQLTNSTKSFHCGSSGGKLLKHMTKEDKITEKFVKELKALCKKHKREIVADTQPVLRIIKAEEEKNS